MEPKLQLSRRVGGDVGECAAADCAGGAGVSAGDPAAWEGGHSPAEIARTVFELLLVLLIFDRLIPQLFFTRTRGLWIARISLLVQVLFYLVLPVTLTIGLLLSIAGLAEPEAEEPEASERGDGCAAGGGRRRGRAGRRGPRAGAERGGVWRQGGARGDDAAAGDVCGAGNDVAGGVYGGGE